MKLEYRISDACLPMGEQRTRASHAGGTHVYHLKGNTSEAGKVKGFTNSKQLTLSDFEKLLKKMLFLT